MLEQNIQLQEVANIPIGTLAKYKAAELHDLLQQVKMELEKAKITKQWIEAAIAIKYQEQITAKRLRLEKDTGVVHLKDEGFKLTSEVVKKVEWNQEALTKIAAQIALNGGNLNEYMQVNYKVCERAYKGWSSGVQALFNAARTIKLGNPIYTLTKLNDGGLI